MTQPKVFVLMPISNDLEDLWELGIKEPAQDLGCVCTRADSINLPGFIVTQIYSEITAADLIVAEMTNQNSNVFYEVGWSHAFNKPTILCAKSSEDLRAFDTAGYRHVLHEGKAHVLRKRLNEIIPEVLKVVPREPADASLIWEWPSDSHTRPSLKWNADSKRTGGQVSSDPNGGQTIKTVTDGSKILTISDTRTNWNHLPDWSIITLLRGTRDFLCGDSVILSLFFRADDDADIEFLSDGSKLNVDGTRVWARGIKTSSREINSRLWNQLLFSGAVEPTEDGQDPSKENGLAFYVRFRTSGTIWVKAAKLYKRSSPKKSLEA